MAENALMQRRAPVEVAIDILKEKYPGAQCAFVGGSFNRGEETATSDIDLVVVFDRLEQGWRESFTFDNWPVEAFVHDPETLAAFFQSDAEDGVGSLPSMILEGPAIPADSLLADRLKTEAAKTIAAGPEPWSQETIDSKRYSITDLVEDLRAPRNKLEAAIIVGALHELLGDFYFRAQQRWSAVRKHIPRSIAKSDPALAKRWSAAFLDAWAGQHEALITLAEDIVAPYGGFLFDGYRSDAPKDKRIKTEP